jgi:NDP-sugar pyrophosphorylase family protein
MSGHDIPRSTGGEAIQAVILAGGLGTRLRPYTTIIPKPLVPVGDRPVVEHIVHALALAGARRIDLCVSHLGELIQLYFSQMVIPESVQLEFHWEEEPLGTAGALRVIPDLDETFIAMNGDVLTNLDYCALLDHHRQSEALLTIAMQTKRVQIELGVIKHTDGYVGDYIEKPVLDYSVSMGIYVYERRALEYLPPGPCQFPDLVLRLIRSNERVAAYLTDADWFDIGTIEEYERASKAIAGTPERFGMSAAGTANAPTMLHHRRLQRRVQRA